ncbi:hypothetical protein D918_03490 [Trichuris suis]|nr:hypothetical protein D918_03490 [Trichuris suis]
MILHLLAILNILSVSLAASLSFLHVPSTIRLPNVDVVLTSELQAIQESFFGLSAEAAGISGVPDNTFNQAVENESSPPLFAADSNSHSTLKVELAAANALNTWLKSAPQLRNGVPDFYLVSFEALSLFDEPSIGGSEAARSAVREIVTVIEKGVLK